MTDFLDSARFRLDHRWAPEHMSAYLDGELASDHRSRVERHVARCEECRRLLAGLRAMLDAMHRLPVSGGESHAARIAACVRRRLTESPS